MDVTLNVQASDPGGTLGVMLRELDQREVVLDGETWILTAYWEPIEGDPRGKIYVTWTRKGGALEIEPVEVEPGKLADMLAHPSMFIPVVVPQAQ